MIIEFLIEIPKRWHDLSHEFWNHIKKKGGKLSARICPFSKLEENGRGIRKLVAIFKEETSLYEMKI